MRTASPVGPPQVSPIERAIMAVAGAVAVVGVALALFVPGFGLRSTDCGSIACGSLQYLGKAAAAGGVGAAMLVIAVVSLRARRVSAAILAALIAFPALWWVPLTFQQWSESRAGTGQITTMVATARDYARANGVNSADGVLTNGRGDWAVVRVVASDGANRYVILARTDLGWAPRAIATGFDKAALAALGAPSDLMKDAE